MVEVVETPEAKLKRHEDALVACMAEIERLRAENASLKANNASAHQTLRAIYADSTQPASVRVKAAQAALNVETPRLESVPPPLDLVAEEVEPLADVVARQRARADRMEREARNIRVLPNGQVLLLDEHNGGNGSDDDTGS